MSPNISLIIGGGGGNNRCDFYKNQQIGTKLELDLQLLVESHLKIKFFRKFVWKLQYLYWLMDKQKVNIKVPFIETEKMCLSLRLIWLTIEWFLSYKAKEK